MKEKNNSFAISTTLLVLVLLASNYIVGFKFSFGRYDILYSICTYPLVFFLANIITRKSGAEKTIIALFIAILVQLFVYFIVGHYVDINVASGVILASIASFGTSQLLNLVCYSKLIKKEKLETCFIYLLYIAMIGIDSIIFYITMGQTLGPALAFSMLFKIVLGLILAAIDSKMLKSIKA